MIKNTTIPELNFYLSHMGEQFRNYYNYIDNIILVDFYRKDCLPCVENVLPLLERIHENYPHIRFYKLEKPYGVKMMEIFGLNCYPTLILYQNGSEIARYEGYRTDEEIIKFIEGIK